MVILVAEFENENEDGFLVKAKIRNLKILSSKEEECAKGETTKEKRPLMRHEKTDVRT